MEDARDFESRRSPGRQIRQEQLANYILQHSFASVEDLSELFKISRMTVHRDLDDLERQGIIRKVHGGASAQPSSLFESDVRYRVQAASREKAAIARLAVSYVEPGQAVMLDDSTTCLPLARLLADITPLTVITNYLTVIRELSVVKGIRLIALGGEYHAKHDAFVGVMCEQAVAALRANVVFMSTAALSGGLLFHQEQEIVKVKQAMLASAARRILLVDSTKLGRVALHRAASLPDFDLVITDAGISADKLQELHEARVPVEVAPL